MIGQRVSHYEIVERLGEGGMGVVYKARDLELGRFVALKVLPADKLADPERRRRFTLEAKAASALNHPNIVTIHESARADGSEFIVMELVAGTTLGQLIPAAGVPLADALRYSIQIADALATAHGAGILHRDLKPANVMVTADGRVKLLDFGLAKLFETPQSASLSSSDPTSTLPQPLDRTEFGNVIGTAAYMSPEQAEGRYIDVRSDIFSFGAVLYEMFTGRRAFRADSPLSTVAAILRDEPPPAADIVRNLPVEAERIIHRCLRKDPDRRFQTMLDVKVALEDLLHESTTGRVTVRVPPRPRAPRRAVWIAVALAAAVITGLIAWPWLGVRRTNAGAQFQVTPLTTETGTQSAPTLSPDGRQVAFIWNGPRRDNFDIYVKMISTDTQLRLTENTAYDGGPVWSPDGNYIAFFRDISPEKTEILLISPLGGRELKVTERWPALGMGMDWSPDSKYLVIPDKTSSSEPFGLFVVSVATGEKRRLTTGTALGDYAPALSPDGRTLAFARSLTDSATALCVLDLNADLTSRGEPRQLTDAGLVVNTPRWTADGQSIIFSAGRPGTSAYNLWRLDLSAPARPTALPFTHGNVRSFAVARTGNRLVYPQVVNDSNIWRVELAGGVNAVGTPEELIASTLRDQNPQFSPDGGMVLFETDRSGRSELWTADRDGSNQQPLVRMSDTEVGAGRWSPDGQRIAFDARTGGRSYIFTVAADGSGQRQLTNDAFDNMVPSWSRDGRFIYFASTRGGGEFQVWKIPASGGPAVQMTKQGGWYAEESSDGRMLYYAKFRSSQSPLWKMSLDDGQELPLLEDVGDRSWTVTTHGIYFVNRSAYTPSDTTAPAHGRLHLFYFDSGKTASMLTFPRPVTYGLSVSADQRHLLYATIDREGSNLMLVDNFR